MKVSSRPGPLRWTRLLEKDQGVVKYETVRTTLHIRSFMVLYEKLVGEPKGPLTVASIEISTTSSGSD